MTPSSIAPRTLARLAFAAIAAWIVAYEVHALVSAGAGMHGLFSKDVHLLGLGGATALCAWRAFTVREERLGWALIAAGIGTWSAGEVYYTQVLWDVHDVPVPSWADLGYLLLCPLWFCGFALIARRRVGDTGATVWIDGLSAALAVAAVGAAVVFEPVVHSAQGRPLAVATNLAYPICDLMIAAMCVAVIALRGWRVDRTWLLVGAGVLTFWAADSVYLVQTAAGTFQSGGPFDSGWWLGLLLVAGAAWQPAGAGAQARSDSTLTIVMPVLFAAVSVGVLGYGALGAHGLNGLAVALACSSLAMVLVRLVVTFRANTAMLADSRREALDDALTGLPNRRALQRDLSQAMQEQVGGAPGTLMLFDLDGFKHYNDSFGHQAGDALLVRLGASLARCLGDRGTAYRMGGDEFCALLGSGHPDVPRLVAGAARALSEHGEGFSITCSWGSVVLGDEASGPEEAQRLADQRMYARKRRGRSSAGRESTDVLLRALAERHPDLDVHCTDVATLVEATALQLGLEPDEIEPICQAAQLHDIGKVAIPEAILHKPGVLDDDEWAYMRRHSVIGERIIAEAPSLAAVAAMVRASHERFDGHGYPDGRAGEDIPLGSRIVCVCDAFDAMTSDRPYGVPVSPAEAEAELRRCAGTQFDPAVVEAFCLVRRQGLPVRAAAA